MPVPRPLLKAMVLAVFIVGVRYFLLPSELTSSPLSWKTSANNVFGGCADDICSLLPHGTVASGVLELTPNAPTSQKGELVVDTPRIDPVEETPAETLSIGDNSPRATSASLRFPHINEHLPQPNHKSTDPQSQFSYVFYALTAECLCSALINIHILRDTFSSPHNITLLHYTELVSSYIPLLGNYDVNTILVAPPVHSPQGPPQKRETTLKLFAASLSQFARVVVLERDQLIFRRLDDLFTIPMDKPVMTPSNVRTSLLLIRPSTRLHADLQSEPGRFPDIAPLTSSYSVAVSVFETNSPPSWVVADGSIVDVLWRVYRRETHVLQFTYPKPWMATSIGRFIDERKQKAHPAYRRGFERWWELKNDVCPGRANDGFGPELALSQLMADDVEYRSTDTVREGAAGEGSMQDDMDVREKGLLDRQEELDRLRNETDIVADSQIV
jgi:hypothetical protein